VTGYFATGGRVTCLKTLTASHFKARTRKNVRRKIVLKVFFKTNETSLPGRLSANVVESPRKGLRCIAEPVQGFLSHTVQHHGQRHSSRIGDESRSHMPAKTTEELWSILVDVLEDFDDADRKGEPLSRDAIAALCTRRTEAIDALMVSLRNAATVSPGSVSA
jgi:hypothetical protein